MKRFLAKVLLLSAPIGLLAAAELLLPLDAFTFRGWEAFTVSPLLEEAARLRLPVLTAFPGPFVPNLSRALVEEGDLGHHTAYAQPRPVVWETDAFGFRAHSHGAETPDLVVVGDSEAAGSGATQDDTLAEILGADHGIATYPYAPSTVPEFLADDRFRDRPPRFVVIECVERNVLETFGTVPRAGGLPRRVRSAAAQKVELALTRIKELHSLEFLRARLRPRRVVAYGGMLFQRGPAAAAPSDPRRIAAAADGLARLAASLRGRGMRAAVMIVPDKETIYSDLLPGAPIPTLLPAIHAALRERGVAVLDLEEIFRAARQRGETPYFLDDTHWNPAGTRLAASALSDWVNGHGEPASGPGVAVTESGPERHERPAAQP
jgi:hypothetical protein